MNAVAGPSGGPYGPQAKTYALPDANNLYFVSPSGDASASGRELGKPTTLTSAFERVSSGDAIVLRGGLYRTGDLLLNQGITLIPYKDEKPILTGAKVASDWEKVSDSVWRTQWTSLFPSEPMFWWRKEREEHRTPLHRFNNDMVFFDGEFLQSAGSIDELNEHNHFIDYANKHVYIGRNPADHTVEITAHEVAITRVSRDVNGKKTDKKGPKIHGITFQRYAWTALSIEGKRSFTDTDEPVDEPIGPADPSTYGKQAVDTLLEDVTIRYVGRVAGYFRGDGLIIRNSLISDTGTEGIYVIGSSNVLLERNIVLNNNIEAITGYYASAVKIINQTHDVVIRDNIVKHHKNSVGVWYDIGNRNGVFINNYIEDTDIGFFFEISRGVTVAGNVFVNNKNGIRILNAADAHIYNNTLVDSLVQIDRNERSSEGDHFGWHPDTGPDVEEREGHIFTNNLLIENNAAKGPLLRIEQPPSVCTRVPNSPLTKLDGNIYVRPNTPYKAKRPALIEWFDTSADDCKTHYDDLAAFKAQHAPFSSHAIQLDGNARNVLKAPDLYDYSLLNNLPTEKSTAMPNTARKHLNWSKKDAQKTIGAYPLD
ncbi:MAG TPA: right-handed parallel beta-helix repeat-containing protein [Marinagarivorans sp.]